MAEFDAILALAIVVVAGILGLTGITSPQLAENAILITLGVLAISILRDRWHGEEAEREVTDALKGVPELLDSLPGQLDRLDVLEKALTEAGQALDQTAVVKLIIGPDVGRAHAQARAHTDRWVFKGGTGTYMRAVTLPELVRTARQERRSLVMRLEILDPADQVVCERYARFRRSLSAMPDGTGEIWTAERTRVESCATILAACWHQERFRLLDLRLGLTPTMTVFRFDLSANGVLITQDDGRLPALLVPSDTFLYASYDTELRNSLEQARRVPLELAAGVPLADEPSPEEVRGLFEVLNLPIQMLDGDVSRVIEKALHARNPYA
ncbi:MAG TPA: hypothetical protein VFE14_03885 [Micromonosporaceae bacterium]|nr:hypothetical protein [Micromonosporaceae bacterium]